MKTADPPRSGLVIGKFLPPHRGHQYLLDFALVYVPELTVLVCSLKSEPIPRELRAAWVKELCPSARVVHVTDENPSEPSDHPDFWRIWIETIRRCLPEGVDVVFSSEPYGDELASRLGASHVIVDKCRELVPVSGTAIRRDPMAHWAFLPECVRPFYARRVVVFGPESTGKTTLCQQLARSFQTVWVSEYARGLLDHKGSPCEPADIPKIARGQVASEEALARRQANRVLFCDTDLVMTTIYSDWYYGNVPAWLHQLADSRRYDLTLLTDIDVPWVADPQRDMPHQREALRDSCLRALQLRGRRFTWIRGSWQERFATAVHAVEALLQEPTPQ